MEKLRGLDLFSGIGGLALALAPWVRTIAYCEYAPCPRDVLFARMRDGRLDTAAIWDDVRTLTTARLLEPVDIIYGGFPCQAFSSASRGRVTAVDLWPEMLAVIVLHRPRYVFAENVARKAIQKAADDLAGIGYVVKCVQMESGICGTPHNRKRFWLLADSDGNSECRLTLNVKMAQSSSISALPGWIPGDTKFVGMDDGLPHRMDRLKALGNAVVPAQARMAFDFLISSSFSQGMT